MEKMMPDLTDEEYDALDEYYTKNPPKVDPAKKGGFFTRQREYDMNCIDQEDKTTPAGTETPQGPAGNSGLCWPSNVNKVSAGYIGARFLALPLDL
jgi:hypothetical protein